MIRGSSRRFRHHAIETKLAKIKSINKYVDHPDQIALVNILIQRCRK